MPRRTSLIAIAMVATCILAGCASTTSPATRAEVQQLRDEVASLRAENAQLKSDLDSAEKNAGPFKTASSFELNPPLKPQKTPLDPNWTRAKDGRHEEQIGVIGSGVLHGANTYTGNITVLKAGSGVSFGPTTQSTQPATKPATQPAESK